MATTETKESKSLVVPASLIGAALTIAFSAGITVSTVHELQSQTTSLSANLEAHEKSPGHIEALARIKALESDNATHGALLRDMSDKIAHIDTNLALVCQATRGANCAH